METNGCFDNKQDMKKTTLPYQLQMFLIILQADKFDNSIILFQAQDKKNINERFIIRNLQQIMLRLHPTHHLLVNWQRNPSSHVIVL